MCRGAWGPSISPAATDFFFVDKSAFITEVWMKLQTPVKYPLPLMATVLEQLQWAQDLCSLHNLFCIREGDEWKTVSIRTSGHYEYWVMYYGLVDVPFVFQPLTEYWVSKKKKVLDCTDSYPHLLNRNRCNTSEWFSLKSPPGKSSVINETIVAFLHEILPWFYS